MRILLCAALIAAAQISSGPERSIVSAVDANNAAALALLEKVVNINSGTHNFAGVRAVGEVFAGEFGDLGFRTTGWTAARSSGRGISSRCMPGPDRRSC